LACAQRKPSNSSQLLPPAVVGIPDVPHRPGYHKKTCDAAHETDCNGDDSTDKESCQRREHCQTKTDPQSLPMPRLLPLSDNRSVAMRHRLGSHRTMRYGMTEDLGSTSGTRRVLARHVVVPALANQPVRVGQPMRRRPRQCYGFLLYSRVVSEEGRTRFVPQVLFTTRLT